MSEKRKDSKGRILRTGESQRANGTYMYRYNDIRGKRQSIYAPTLAELREKQKEIARDLDDEIDYAAGQISVIDQVDKYLATRRNFREKTKATYADSRKWIVKHEISQKCIRDVKPSEAKQFVVWLSDQGLSFQTVCLVKALLSPAFDLAVDDKVLRHNPFQFKLKDVIPKNAAERQGLTPMQKEAFLEFLRTDHVGQRYYDVAIVLLGSGMRISELCGLTLNDIDFVEKKIVVYKQLLYLNHHGLYVDFPKTESGNRCIPMTEEVCSALKRIISQRPTPNVEPVVDGYSGFLFIGRQGNPKKAKNFQVSLKTLVDRYNQSHSETLAITPHVLRHTFCSDLVADKIDPKSLQYIMGHHDLKITMQIYTHTNYDRVAQAIQEIEHRRASQKQVI